MKNILSWFANLSSTPPRNERTSYEIEGHIKKGLEQWQYEADFARILSELRSAYLKFLNGDESHPDIDFMKQDASNGFILDAHRIQLPMDKSLMLLAHWKQVLQSLHYINSMSDLRLKAKGSRQYSWHRHYMKPSKRRLEPGDQRFGNIELVCQMVDNQPDHIKVQSNAYVDSMYQEAEPFADLMFKLTETY